MKQDKHMDIDALLRELPATAGQVMDGLEATPFLKARIDRAVNEKKQGKVRFSLPAWAPALCCAAVVLVLALTVFPMTGKQTDGIIDSGMLGDPTPVPANVMTADLNSGSVFISGNSAKPGYRSI